MGPNSERTGLPEDPETAELEASIRGIHRVAVLVGAMRRELLTEGFSEEEAYGLCEAWMVEALCETRDAV